MEIIGIIWDMSSFTLRSNLPASERADGAKDQAANELYEPPEYFDDDERTDENKTDIDFS